MTYVDDFMYGGDNSSKESRDAMAKLAEKVDIKVSQGWSFTVLGRTVIQDANFDIRTSQKSVAKTKEA